MASSTYAHAIQERDQHTDQYLRGMIQTTPAAKAYAERLQEIKLRYNEVRQNDDIIPSAVDRSVEKKSVFIAIAAFLGWLVVYNLIPERNSVTPKVIYNIIMCVALGIAARNVVWGAVPFVLLIFAGIFEIDSAAVLIMLGIYVVMHAKDWFSKKSFSNAYANSSLRIGQLREELLALLPAMRSELQTWQLEWYYRYQDCLTESDLLDYQSDEAFPPAFWWQIAPSEIRSIIHRFDCSRYGGWETRLIHREPGQEFDAVDEYSPLFGMLNGSREEIMDFYRNDCHCEVFDAISREVSVDVHTKTISYEVPAHSDLQKLAVSMDVMSLAKRIDKSYNEGNLSTAEYRHLASEVGSLASAAAEYNNQTKTEYSTEYIPIHHHTNFWVGQFMLRALESNAKQEAYVLMQYFCQMPHMFENLSALDCINIAFIEYDLFDCNPYFLAECYSRHPNAF